MKFPSGSFSKIIVLTMIALAGWHCDGGASGKSADQISADSAKVAINEGSDIPTAATQKWVELPKWPTKERVVGDQIFPFDEGPLQADFKAFRDTFYQAVVRKDVDELLRMTHDDIKVDFGGGGGKAYFIKAWQLDSMPQNSPIWQELAAALELGGGFSMYNEPVFMAPYVFVTDKIGDPYEEGVVVGENVRLRESPSTDGKIIGSLTYNKVNIIRPDGNVKQETIDGETHYWQQVKTTGGQKGFVYSKYLRQPVGYRTVFMKSDGQWLLGSFLAGD